MSYDTGEQSQYKNIGPKTPQNFQSKLMHEFDEDPETFNPQLLDQSFQANPLFMNVSNLFTPPCQEIKYICSIPNIASQTSIMSNNTAQRQCHKPRRSKMNSIKLVERQHKVRFQDAQSPHMIERKEQLRQQNAIIECQLSIPDRDEDQFLNNDSPDFHKQKQTLASKSLESSSPKYPTKYQISKIQLNQVVPSSIAYEKNTIKQQDSKEMQDLMSSPTFKQQEYMGSPQNRLYSNPESGFSTQGLLEKQKTKGQSSSIMIYYLFKRFLTKISVKRRQKLFFTAKHFSIVGDKASEKIQSLSELRARENYKKTSKGGKLGCSFLRSKYKTFQKDWINLFTKLLKYVPLVYPQQMSKIIWDIILSVVLMYFFVMIPIEIAFDNDILYTGGSGLTILFVIFLLIDYIVKMNTVYYEYDKPVIDRSLIFAKYMKNGFFIDGLSITVLILSLANSWTFRSQLLNISLVLFYTQFHYFFRIIAHAEESLNLSKIAYSLLNLSKLIFTMLFVIHLFSCLWYYVAVYKQSLGETNWMQVEGIINEQWHIKYLDSFYFSTVTMLTIGYGDITPQNPVERLLCILFILFACIQLSYSINTVAVIINEISQNGELTKKKIRIINKYMNDKGISFELQYQVREYLKMYWLKEVAEENQEGEKIIGNLSEGLRDKLIFEATNTVLQRCPLFQTCFSTETKMKLLKLMKTFVLSPESLITSQLPNVGEPCLCFVESGDLSIHLNPSQNQDNDLVALKKGQYFGLEQFITGQPPVIQLSSKSFVKLLIITRSDFLQVLNDNPNDYEEFCMIRDQYLMNYKNTEKCMSCGCTGHDIQNCPLVHFVIDKEKIIKQHQFVQTQKRKAPFNRNIKRPKNQYSALIDQWAVQVQNIQINLHQQELSLILQHQEQEICYFYDKINMIYQSQQPNIESFINQEQDQKKSSDKQEVDAQPKYSTSSKANQQLLQRSPPEVSVRKNKFQQFQRVVGKLIKNQRMKQKKGFLSNVNLNFKTLQVENQRIQNFNKNQFLSIVKLKREEEELIARNSLTTSQQNEINFLLLKMQLLNAHLPKSQISLNIEFNRQFELQKDFHLYFPENNASKVVSNYQEFMVNPPLKVWFNLNLSKLDTGARQKVLSQSLGHYMFFPQEYFRRYCKHQPKEDKLTLTITKPNARLLFQKFKQKNEQKGRISIQTKNTQLKNVAIAAQTANKQKNNNDLQQQQ